MRARAVRMIVSVVAVVCVVMGLPGAFFASVSIWASEQRDLEVAAQRIVQSIDRRNAAGESTDAESVAALVADQNEGRDELSYRILVPGHNLITDETEPTGRTMAAFAESPSGVSVQLTSSASGATARILWACGMFGAGMIGSMLIGLLMARSLSRSLSAPLIYLAAQAEQIGSGGVRARVEESGFEEIDLVSEELARTGERMAGRLAAERQAAADASHQLRTPLTALSMRLEEIELISSEEEVRAEARTCLEQVERMTNVVSELLDVSKRQNGGQTEAIHILEVFNTTREEWEDQFKAAGRPLVFLDEAERPILADAGKLGQVLATLIENSLRYGDGVTRVWAHAGSSKRGVIIEVSDEGEGIDEALAPDIFEKGVSGHGSTGIGLALAHDLAQAMGGRLELKSNIPPVFTISVAAIPASLDPDRVMPEGPLISMGRRSRRF